MAKAWRVLDSVSTDEGLLELRQRDERDFLITVGGRVLMNSTAHRSEMALGQLACDHLKKARRPRVLVGGLGMGFTLKAVLDSLPDGAEVVVAELNPAVAEWYRGPLATLTDSAVTDPRVEVEIDDVARLIGRFATADGLGKLDAVILDLYTGPYMHSHKTDDPLYGSIAIRATHTALQPGGVFAVWGENYDAGFAGRLAAGGFAAGHRISNKSGFRHVIYLGKKSAEPS